MNKDIRRKIDTSVLEFLHGPILSKFDTENGLIAYVRFHSKDDKDAWINMSDDCVYCEETGRISHDKFCPDCKGIGRVYSSRKAQETRNRFMKEFGGEPVSIYESWEYKEKERKEKERRDKEKALKEENKRLRAILEEKGFVIL